jgi:DNA-nicking Smr family endonuclease
MDFGDVLDEWERIERERARQKGVASIRGDAPVRREASELEPEPEASEREVEARRSALAAWIDGHEVCDKDSGDSPALGAAELRAEREERARRFAALSPQASIDLHGMGAREAETALELFLEDSARRGLEKVLVVHGKGNHSAGEPVLRRVARTTIEHCPWAGRSGEADRAQGGSGAVWVAIRKLR